MLSKALLHYPQFRFRNGEKVLWNPILKKTFKNRPEERIRLELIDYLTLEAGFSPHRISFESPVKLPGDKTSSRTDVICYDEEFKPLLLIECKSGDIRLDEQAAVQVSRYNQKVNARYLLASNGLFDFWFDLQQQENGEAPSLEPLKEIPVPFQPKNQIQRSFSYYQERGFAGSESHPDSRSFILQSCHSLYTEPRQHIIFLAFEDFSPELSLANYYRVYTAENRDNLALSISATPYGGSRLNAVLNRQGTNTALLSTSLDLISKQEKKNTIIHSAKGETQLDLSSECSFSLEDDITAYISTFKELMKENS